MRIQIIGVGSKYFPENGNPSMILWGDGHGFLINCGYTVFPFLKSKNLIPRINEVFITNREADNAGSLDIFLDYRKNVVGKPTKFFGLVDNLDYLMEIDQDFGNKRKEYFNLDKNTSIVTIPVHYKRGVTSEAFFNFGLLYSGNTGESLLETPQAREAKVIIHHVSFDDLSDSEVPFSVLARGPVEVRRKTWLIGYKPNEDVENFNKVMQFGFAGFLKPNQIIDI
jgi:ribonuclease BN (tRNA processing enzyme)